MARLEPETILGVRRGQGFAPTMPLHAAWRAAGAARGIPAGLTLTDLNGRPTVPFLGLWRAAFPTVRGLRAADAILTRDGRPTAKFLDAFRALPE